MGPKFIILLLVVCHVVFNTEVEAGGWYNISKQEDMEFGKQLKLLNKPAVKSVQINYGDIYDCVDFYEQPAFDHPLLKDHKFDYKMKPTLLSPKHTNGPILNETSKLVNFNFKRLKDGCPAGTIPIRRITKEDLIREKYSSTIRPQDDDNNPGSHYAVVRFKPSAPFVGAGAQMTLHNPQCADNQYSAARLKVQNGPDSIEAGWRVDQALYGDKQTRMYIRVDAGQSHCFNTRCPGFVIVNTEVPLDHVFTDLAKPGGPWTNLRVYLNRDMANGNWWLQVGKEFDLLDIGFWPQRIFTGLSSKASIAEWGGEVFSPPGTVKPPMGAGQNIARDRYIDAFFFNPEILDGEKTIDPKDLESFQDTENYRVSDLGYVDEDYGHVIVYGGPSSN